MKERVQGLITGIVAGIIITGSIGVLAAQYTATENTFPVKVNGLEAAMEGYNINGSTYFKLRDIGDRMGFNVDFQDNTIYIGDIPKTNDIKFYSEKTWCPDFGAFTGAELLDTKTSDRFTVYTYSMYFDGDISDYYDLILEYTDLNLNPASTADFVMFENLKSSHTISCMISKDATIKIIVE